MGKAERPKRAGANESSFYVLSISHFHVSAFLGTCSHKNALANAHRSWRFLS